MALAFPQLSWWFWGGKDYETAVAGTGGSVMNGTNESVLGVREENNINFKFPCVKGSRMNSTSSRRVKRKWQSREQRRIDREYDVVLVSSDGGCCLSGSESDDSDWSIGWLEPHASDFLSEDENDNSFAVLVPCYGRDRSELVEDSSNDRILGAIISANFPNGYPSEHAKYMEEWLSSLKHS